MSIRRGVVMLVAAAATLGLSTPARASAAVPAAAGGTEIVVADTAFGPALAVGSGPSACSASAACARAWPPVLTEGAPAWTGGSTPALGGLGLPGGLTQVTWFGQPLYLFSQEEPMPLPNGAAAPTGNGNGVKAFGGTFSLVRVS